MSRLQFLEKDAHKLVNDLTDYIFDEIYNRLRNRRKTLISRIQAQIAKEFPLSPTVQSMLYGKLKGELGLDSDIVNILANILSVIENNVKVSITSNRKQQTLSVQFGFDASAYDELFVSGTTFTSLRGFEIEWLRWLLEQGDDIIWVGYKYKAGNFEMASRSGEGIMRSQEGAFWKVPSEFAGTEDRNFITKMLNIVEHEIFSYVEKIIEG